MNPSLYLQLIQQYFPGLVTSIVERYNGENVERPYLYRRFLRPEFSIDGKWTSLNINNSLVAADIVAMDSDIALKKRPSMGQVNGDIPKMGMKLAINEKELTDLHSLVARLAFNNDGNQAQIVQRLFRDVDHVIAGGYERIEMMFLQGLSTGAALVSDSETAGTGVRVDYGYSAYARNAFTSTTPWATVASAKPLSDMQRLIDYATDQGDVITRVFMDRATFNNIAASAEGRGLYAQATGFAGQSQQIPTLEQLNRAIQDKYGFVIEIVERSIRQQRNGVNVPIRPWAAGRVVAVTSDQIGTLAYARLAEQDHPAEYAEYQLADQFMLISKYRQIEPSLAEMTKMQARVVPVINNVQSIYTLDSTITSA